MNASMHWTGLAVIAVVLAAIVLGIRMAPGGWIGLAVKGVLGALAVIVIGVMVWNTVVFLIHRTR
jgi:hypothetical protein